MVVIQRKALQIHSDLRGSVFEVLRSEDVQGNFGQILISTANPGETKGGHYHTRKREWYCVISGRGRLRLQNVNGGEVIILELNSEQPEVIEIPINTIHEIRNVGTDKLMLLAYTNEVYDANNPDTIPAFIL